jgi:hypothetical protein
VRRRYRRSVDVTFWALVVVVTVAILVHQTYVLRASGTARGLTVCGYLAFALVLALGLPGPVELILLLLALAAAVLGHILAL